MVVDEIINYQILYFVHVFFHTFDLNNLIIITTISGTNQRMSYLIQFENKEIFTL